LWYHQIKFPKVVEQLDELILIQFIQLNLKKKNELKVNIILPVNDIFKIIKMVYTRHEYNTYCFKKLYLIYNIYYSSIHDRWIILPIFILWAIV